MNTMKWLIRRELWEHKGMLVWTPAAIAALIGALGLAALFFTQSFQYNGQTFHPSTIIVEGEIRTRVVDMMAQSYAFASAPVFLVLAFLVLFYCLGALHDERRDRSILFWKSLPVSDTATVLSKAVVALLVAPLIVLAVSFALSLLLLIAACIKLSLHGTHLYGELLASPDLYLTPLRLAGLLPVYMLWALPSVGWLLMVSSMARSKVFLWAVGTPLVTGLLLIWAEKMLGFGINASWLIFHVLNRLLLGLIPGSWMGFTRHTPLLEDTPGPPGLPALFFGEGWATLTHPGLWLGVAAGVAMIAVAVWMRRRREEG